ncbi:MAG: dihydropteroate synthase [Bacteroidetes bacterium]|nr:dihydropteroate synthase [Bacteroidota bacterium]
MGILNITSDSFYDGGKYLQPGAYLAQAEKMIQEGADILDIGAYSTRPGAAEVDEATEKERLTNAIAAIRKQFPEVLISADTFRASVAKKAIEAGANIINDISGGTMDEAMFNTVAELDVPYILMHIQGTPQTMQVDPQYKNVTKEVKNFFEERIEQLNKKGFKKIILDPGFGFGKTIEHNYQLLREMDQFQSLGLPVLAGLSRKSMIYKLLNIKAEESLNGTSVLNSFALQKGAKILRVHDVKEAKEVVQLHSLLHKK